MRACGSEHVPRTGSAAMMRCEHVRVCCVCLTPSASAEYPLRSPEGRGAVGVVGIPNRRKSQNKTIREGLSGWPTACVMRGTDGTHCEVCVCGWVWTAGWVSGVGGRARGPCSGGRDLKNARLREKKIDRWTSHGIRKKKFGAPGGTYSCTSSFFL